MTPKHYSLITGSKLPLALLALTFLISLVLHLFTGPEIQGRIFFFPLNTGARIGSERRGIPERKLVDDQIEIFLNELLLGPETLALTHTAPEDTRILNVAVVERTVYVNVSQALLNADQELPVSIDEALANLRFNILFNFPRMEEIVFTIEGQQVHAPYYPGPETAE